MEFKTKTWEKTHLEVELHQIIFLRSNAALYLKTTLYRFNMLTYEKLCEI